jgi:hypothetical protein
MSVSNNPDQIREIENYWKLDSDDLARLFVSSEEARAIRSEMEDFQTGRGYGNSRRYPISDKTAFEWAQRAISARGEAAAKRFVEINREWLCDNYNYCNKRKELGGEGPALAISVADGLFMATTGIPFPITALSVFLVKRGILDRLCDCGNV